MPNEPAPADFSLTGGGPTFRLLSRLGLARSTGRKLLLAWLLTWLPLAALAVLQTVLTQARAELPFLFDVAVHARFLISVPLLIMAEHVVDRWLGTSIRQFEDEGFLIDDDHMKFRRAVDSAIRMRDSTVAEALILVLVLISALIAPARASLSGVATWIRANGVVSAAGWWYGLVSIPIYQFLIYRWLWRYAIWSILLRRIAALRLQLAPAHPDHVGGLEFVLIGQRTFAIVAFSASAVVAAMIANAVIYRHDPLTRYQTLAAVYIVLTLVIFLIPLAFFTSSLRMTKLRGLIQYDALGYRYTREFHEKWIASPGAVGHPILGTSDIQSLADLSTAYETVRNMQPALIKPRLVLTFALAAAAPMIPLLLLVIPGKTLLRALYSLIRAIMG